jgi:hypothetical protein
MKSETKEKITRFLATIICIVLNLFVLLALTASAFQTNLRHFLQLA